MRPAGEGVYECTVNAPGGAAFIVVFRATVREFDDEYSRVAARMRDLALEEFGCLEFHALTEGNQEVALSYWPSEEAIAAWKQHPEHVFAQEKGRSRWYESYSVEVTRVERAYRWQR